MADRFMRQRLGLFAMMGLIALTIFSSLSHVGVRQLVSAHGVQCRTRTIFGATDWLRCPTMIFTAFFACREPCFA